MIDLEQDFRNGVILARLGNSFAPTVVPYNKIFDPLQVDLLFFSGIFCGKIYKIKSLIENIFLLSLKKSEKSKNSVNKNPALADFIITGCPIYQ